MKRIQVLLSAYNGENYIAEQIKSILRQKHVQVSLLIRDDGSEDATWKILSEYAAKHRNVCVYAGKNIGTQKSYFDLLAHADSDMDYFAFSDQDDVWHTHKLRRAVEILSQQSEKGWEVDRIGKQAAFICFQCDLRIGRFAHKNTYLSAETQASVFWQCFGRKYMHRMYGGV